MFKFFNKRRPVIIGIHGLSNKPPHNLLQTWWQQSIEEGLQRIGYDPGKIQFHLVYWADIMYPKPLDPDETNPDSPYILSEPYYRLQHGRPAPVKVAGKKNRLDFIERSTDLVFTKWYKVLPLDWLVDKVTKKRFPDLHAYFNPINRDNENHVRNQIHKRLTDILIRFRKRRIILLGHSMGSIISYDVLKLLEKDLNIEILVTVGSPLGLPFIRQQFSGQKEEKNIHLTVPENIRQAWYNMSDLDDKVAINYSLADDYLSNGLGVGVKDLQVVNDYHYAGVRNTHKIYGYLRTPELAAIFRDFLEADQPFWRRWITRLSGFFKK